MKKTVCDPGQLPGQMSIDDFLMGGVSTVSMEDSQGTATLYWCDPEKNTECQKKGCAYLLTRADGGICSATFRREYAREYENGEPMVYEGKLRRKQARRNLEQKRRDF